ncbi:hypothetical protein KZ813_06055 [Sphingomonas sp. RHCKR7]|uniref:helix-turn-helix domain-containing protein n=1 Tax=Sphingomonas folli TaxID=2862497 RepID=UPI001CA5D7E0|nr:helix-turn-helix domain-containing protein [Sphingomonas folli]MBW6526398.1 hypothetical protein [Sphingomonas folli]
MPEKTFLVSLDRNDGSAALAIEGDTTVGGAGFKAGTIACAQRLAVMNALEVTHLNISSAAKMLGVGRTTLYRLMCAYGIQTKLMQREKAEGLTKVSYVDGEWFLTETR